MEEKNKEELANETVAWGEKILSPGEVLSSLIPFLRRRVPGPITLEMPFDFDTLTGSTVSQEGLLVDEVDHSAMAAFRSISESNGHTLIEKVTSFCNNGSKMFFTRPPSEDYIDPAEEAGMVDPPQPSTPLCQAVLRDHRTKNLPSRRMHLAYAIGRLRGGSTLEEIVWSGSETMLCAMDMINENELHAKPSLDVEHTCYVDASYIYTFKVGLQTTDPRQAETRRPSGINVLRSAVIARTFANMLQEGVRASRKLEAYLIRSTAREEKDKVVMLKQAVMTRLNRQQRASSGINYTVGQLQPPQMLVKKHQARSHAPTVALFSNGVEFTPPPRGENVIRLHVMGVLQTIKGIPRTSLFVRCRFMLPLNSSEDKEINLHAGLQGSFCEPVTSQLSFASYIQDKDYAYKTEHVFNLPIELHATLCTVNPTPVRLLLSVFSKGSGGNHYQSVEGYGQVTIPIFPGTYQVSTLLWRPKPTAMEYLKSVFIGGAPAMADDEDAALPKHATNGYYSRLGLQTESRGTANLSLMIVTQGDNAFSISRKA